MQGVFSAFSDFLFGVKDGERNRKLLRARTQRK